ncbi:hypothetical protein IQ238_29920 [Pleurocapsales cyanobacterium LEGE 06147]|nr:hypothetical protein [Pleurocapsales cyanobacterium LEGE 06147]
MTQFEQIEKWWKIMFSVYWMISSQTKVFYALNQPAAYSNSPDEPDETETYLTAHQQWSNQGGWKSTLNNLRLVIQPFHLLYYG